MAVKDSREVTIEATPDQVFAVIADVESTPDWSPQYQRAEVLERYDDGRPKTVVMSIKTAGISDDLTVEYSWTDDSANWRLLKATTLKSQVGKYTLTQVGNATKVRFDIAAELLIPLPGFILKRAMKGAMEVATDGLRKQVLKVMKSGN